jgi:hypothetical protein
MGTGLDIDTDKQRRDMTKGIIPRAVEHLYDGIVRRQKEAKANGLPVPDFQM